MKLRKLFVCAIVVFAALTNAQATFNIYIKTDPELPGEVTTPAAWLNAWEILSFSIGASAEVQVTSGGLTPGAPQFQNLAIQKKLDKASVATLLKLAQGGKLNSLTLTCVNAANNAVLYEITLEEVVFTSVADAGSTGGDDRPTESVALDYGKITWTYHPPTGSPISAFWDRRTGSGG